MIEERKQIEVQSAPGKSSGGCAVSMHRDLDGGDSEPSGSGRRNLAEGTETQEAGPSGDSWTFQYFRGLKYSVCVF